jgi:MtrB/PioB family decaheme-associated outer membrane protein
MKSKLCLFFMILALMSVSAAFAEEKNLTGEVSVMGVLPYVSGNEAKFSEYRDLKDGTLRPFVGGSLEYDNKKGYFLDFNASDIGFDTQEYRLEGGKYGSYKYRLFYNEIIHNWMWNARTFYTGAGSNTLTYAPATGNRPTNNPDLWNEFDYSIHRKQFGGGVDLKLLKPFFISFDVGRELRDGIKPSTSANAVEAPEPVDYTTDYLKAAIGYAKQPFFGSLNYYYQKFSNDDRYLYSRSPLASVNNLEQKPLAPANDYHNLSFLGNMKLPWNSKFNTKLAWARATSDKGLVTQRWGTGSTPTTVSYNDPTFNGEFETQNYQFVLSSAPLSFLDGKAFYQYYKKDNKSNQITYTQGATVAENELFEYTKQNYGAELDFRLMKGLHLTGGYTHYYIDRERTDIPKNNDDYYKAELKYTGLSIATIRAGYEYLVRAADHTWQTSDGVIEQYVRRFDAAARNQTTWKVDLQIYPVNDLNFNIMYKYVKNDYKDTTIGITKDERNFWGVNADYALQKWFKVSGYFDWEEVTTDQFQRRGTTAPFGATQTSTNYNWTANQTYKDYDWGLGAEVYVIPKKLTVKAGYDNVRSNGKVDLTYLIAAGIPAGYTQESVDLRNGDTYRKEGVFIKFIYSATTALSLTAGYAYESYRYTDPLFDGYQYVYPAGSASPTIYLTGANSSPSYKANVVYFGAAYKF